jgi:UPF0271 protein
MEIDLNADLGEGYGRWRIADDESLLKLVSSANIACGYHAGDAVIMARTVAACHAGGIDIGAHVGFEDREGFGRRRMEVEPAEFAQHVLYQLGALHGIAAAAKAKVSHMSFHGALGNMVAEDEALAETLVRAVAAYNRDLVLATSPGSETMKAAQRAGLPTVGKFLADRAYDAQGRLVSRKRAGSVIKDEAAIAKRVTQLLDDGTVETIDGERIRIEARSILVHSDTPGAVALATTIRDAILAGGGRVVPLTQLVK